MTDKSNEQIYAPFSVRFVAFILDLVGAIIFFILFLIPLIISFYSVDPDDLDGQGSDIAAVYVVICLGSTLFLYHIYSVYCDYKSNYFNYNYQATPGKYWLNLMVVNYEGNRVSLPAAFGRFVIFTLTFIFFPPILLMIHFTERKQGLHDFICKTYVMQELTPDLLNKD